MTKFYNLLKEYIKNVKNSNLDTILDRMVQNIEKLKYKKDLLDGFIDQPFIKGKVMNEEIFILKEKISKELKNQLTSIDITNQNKRYSELKRLESDIKNYFMEYDTLYMKFKDCFSNWVDSQKNLFSVLDLDISIFNELLENYENIDKMCIALSDLEKCDKNILKINLELLEDIRKYQLKVLSKFEKITKRFSEPEKIEKIWKAGGCRLNQISNEDLMNLKDSEIGAVMKISLMERKK